MIREAVAADVPALVTLGRTMRARTVYARLCAEDPAAMAAQAAALIASPDGAIWVDEGETGLRAMFGAHLYVHPFAGTWTLGEQFWFGATKGAGLRVYYAALAWGRARGAAQMTMGAPIGAAAVHRLIGRLGFTAIEVAFVKDLQPAAAGVAA